MTETEKKYSDARSDIIKALKSVSELEDWQKRQLANELLGVETVVAMYNMMRQYFG